MDIIITNRFDIEEAEFNCPHIVISMADDVNLVPYIPKKNCQGVLKIAVWHINGIENLENNNDIGDFGIPKDKIFNKLHAKKILDFVFKNLNEIELIVCQCDTGTSRCTATAAALSKILNGKNEEFFKSPYCPNKLIYGTILDEYRNMQKGKITD